MKTKYYGLFDVQLGGFKAQFVETSKQEMIEAALDRIYTIHEDFLEGELTWDEVHEQHTDIEIIEMLDYEIKEISKEQADIILNSEEFGLLTTVDMT